METSLVEWFVKDIATGVIVGVVASGVFVVLLSRLRPRVEISPWLHRKADITLRDGPCFQYLVKIRNHTRSPIIDVRAQLHLIWPSAVDSRKLLKRGKLPWYGGREDHDVFVIDRYDARDQETAYLYRFTFSLRRPLEDLLAAHGGAFLRFRVFARHAFSGYGDLIERRFEISNITRRNFRIGDTLDVEEAESAKRGVDEEEDES